MRPMPAEVIIKNGNSYLVRRRLTNKELANQIISECNLNDI